MYVKHLLAILFATAMTATATAQMRGDWVMGGSIQIESTESLLDAGGRETLIDGDINGTSFALLPSIHYFVSDRISLGVALGYRHAKTFMGYANEDPLMDKLYDDRGEFVIQPSFYYYVELCDWLFYAPKTYVDFRMGKNKYDYYDATSGHVRKMEDIDTFHFGFGMNLTHFEVKMTERVSLGIGLGLGDIAFMTQHEKMTHADGSESTHKKRSFVSNLNSGNWLGNIDFTLMWYL